MNRDGPQDNAPATLAKATMITACWAVRVLWAVILELQRFRQSLLSDLTSKAGWPDLATFTHVDTVVSGFTWLCLR